MQNETRYDGRTLRRWIRACFDTARFRRLQIRVSYGRSSHCSGSAARRGISFHLSLPSKPERLTADDLSFTISYLALIHQGISRWDMTREQKIPGVRSWHRDLPLPAFRPEPPKPSSAERRKLAVERKANHAKKMYAKYDLLEAAYAVELLRFGKLKKIWARKVTYYKKKGF